MNLRDSSKIQTEDINKKAIATIRAVVFLMVVVVLSLVIYTFVGQRVTVYGSSMEPMFSDGEILIVDKWTYRSSAPDRFDVIVFPSKTEENTLLIKRIIGLPGESVQIDEEGQIYIDGKILEENFGKEIIKDPGIAKSPVVLGEEEYFVLGDNRNNSVDSRKTEVGAITKSSIVGKTVIRVLPFEKMGKL